MDFSEHVIISAAGSAALLAGGAGWEAAAAFSATGVFIDLDHFVDYWRETGFNLDIPRFMDYFPKGHGPKHMWLLLHAWEWTALGWAAALYLGAPGWVLWGLTGWFQHLLLDGRFNYLQPFSYFFAYRAWRRFDSKYFNEK